MKCCQSFLKTFVPIAFGVGTFVVGMGIIVHHGRVNARDAGRPPRTVALLKPHKIDISPPRPAPPPQLREPRQDAERPVWTGWAKTMAEQYPADVYASADAAVSGLALQLPQLLAADDGSQGIVAVSAGGCVSPEMARDFIAAAGRLPDSKWTFQQRTDATDPSNWTAELTRDAREDTAEPAGSLRLSLRRGDRSIEATVDYAEKSWITREAEAAVVVAGGDQVVAQSTQPEASPDAAERSAQHAAAEVLQRIIRDRANDRRLNHALDEGILADRIRAALFSGSLVTDRFVQRFSRPYGDVWRTVLRVDASDGALRGVIQNARRDTVVQRDRRQAGLAASAGLLLVIVALYVVLNAVTKGYFTWRLRGAAVAATVVVMVAMVALLA